MKVGTDQDARISFGRLLQKTRLEKRIRLEDISRQTRIRVPILLSIEKEELDRLPPEPYLQGLLKAFAKAVEIDGREVLRRYEQDRRDYDKRDRFQWGTQKSDGGGWLKLGFILGLLLLLAAGSIYLMTFVSGKVDPEKGLRMEPAGETSPPGNRSDGLDGSGKIVPGERGRQVEPSKEAENESGARRPLETTPEKKIGIPETNKEKDPLRLKTDGYLLSIHAVKNTWLKVIADDQEMIQYHLKTGDRLDLTASSRFNILIGDAKGVQITLNERPFPVSGKNGQIVNIEIP